MKRPVVGLVDYDMGNLKSVSKAMEAVGLKVKAVDSPAKMRGVDGILLPGVGAFRVAVRNLKARKLFKPLRTWIAEKKPFFGICLGYQLLFQKGMEGGKPEKGLGIFKGEVRRFRAERRLKVPHMGWNRVRTRPGDKPGKDFFRGIPSGSYFYFVHSYFPVPRDKGIVAAQTRYGVPFASGVAWDRSFACQFHPEKSGANGLKLLKNFASVLGRC